MAARVHYRAEIFEEDGTFVSLSPELNVSSFGDTPEDAANSLQEAVELFLEGCEDLGTLRDVLEESGFIQDGEEWQLRERITESRTATLP